MSNLIRISSIAACAGAFVGTFAVEIGFLTHDSLYAVIVLLAASMSAQVLMPIDHASKANV